MALGNTCIAKQVMVYTNQRCNQIVSSGHLGYFFPGHSKDMLTCLTRIKNYLISYVY